MKLEITTQQFYQTQNEIIRLEEELTRNYDHLDPWSRSFMEREINMLKNILTNEEIDLGEMNI